MNSLSVTDKSNLIAANDVFNAVFNNDFNAVFNNDFNDVFNNDFSDNVHK
jgi:hypothetical protein